MIGVLDYGVGNVGAFLRIYHSNIMEATSVKSSKDFSKIDRIILPGVGSFDSAMKKLNESGLRKTLDKFVLNDNYPLLGVCIGMHMLGMSSDEGNYEGLGYINGITKKIGTTDDDKKILIPHMGWNNIKVTAKDPIWFNINMDEGFYFLHSFCFLSLMTELQLLEYLIIIKILLAPSSMRKFMDFSSILKKAYLMAFNFCLTLQRIANVTSKNFTMLVNKKWWPCKNSTV